MSKYCGKCDIGDCYSDKTDAELQRTRFIIGDKEIPINTQKELLPYYPFMMAMSYCNDKGPVVHMSFRSYVDTYEEEMLTFYMEQAQKEYRSAKRKKTDFDVKKVVKKISWRVEPYITEIVERVAKDGKKATIEGISMTGMVPIYRQELYDDMIAAGYAQDYAKWWVYEKGNVYERPALNENLIPKAKEKKKKKADGDVDSSSE